jgi:hypothetical protein
MSQSHFRSRRNLLRGAFARVGVGAGDSQDKSQAGSMRLTTHDDNEFETTLRDKFPGVLGHEIYPRLKPYMALLHNQTSAAAKAYSVEWNVTDPVDGSKQQLLAFVIRKHRTSKALNPIIKPGDLRLISPYFHTSPAGYTAKGRTLDAFIPRDISLSYADAVSVAIDCVVYAHGTFTGPDNHELRKHYIAVRNAEHDEAYSVNLHLKALSGPDTVDLYKIDALLQYHHTYGAQASGSSAKTIYWNARSVEAAILRRKLSSGGLESLKKCIGRRLRYRPASLHTTS